MRLTRCEKKISNNNVLFMMLVTLHLGFCLFHVSSKAQKVRSNFQNAKFIYFYLLVVKKTFFACTKKACMCFKVVSENNFLESGSTSSTTNATKLGTCFVNLRKQLAFHFESSLG